MQGEEYRIRKSLVQLIYKNYNPGPVNCMLCNDDVRSARRQRYEGGRDRGRMIDVLKYATVCSYCSRVGICTYKYSTSSKVSNAIRS